jgi:hypothetical protein
MPKRNLKSKPLNLQAVPDSPEVERQRAILAETSRELKDLIRKINSRAKKNVVEGESDDSPELPPAA